ncbi:MAG: hypothetical protein HQ503_06415 [Rhodospirillales bacterium]|nr:hypothetical protein [Rhodospirillales bacterium]
MIHDDTIRTWIDRGIENKEMAEIVEETVLKIKTMGPDAKSADDILLACVLLILDPYRPITYKHAVYMPDGFGPALALEVVNNGYVQDLAESILRDIPAVWYEMRPSGGADVTEAKTFQELHEHLANTKIGYGIERCIYQMNTGFACRSPILAGRRVTEIEELLPALSEVEKETNDTSKPPIDRHIAAFILASHTSDIEKLFTNLQDSSEAVAALSVLTLYAKLQQDLGPEELPGLAKWLGGLLAPVIRQFKSRKTRRNLEAEVPRLVRRGQLPALLNLLMDIETRYNDQQDYIAARVEFLSADEEIGRVEKNSDPESETVLHFSRKIAAVTSIVFMIILVTMMIIAA